MIWHKTDDVVPGAYGVYLTCDYGGGFHIQMFDYGAWEDYAPEYWTELEAPHVGSTPVSGNSTEAGFKGCSGAEGPQGQPTTGVVKAMECVGSVQELEVYLR